MISNLFNVCYNDKMMKYAPTSNLTMTTPYSPEVVFVPLCPLGKGPATKSDEFLEKFQRGERGGHFRSKNLCCRFWELQTGLFEHEIDKKRVISGFRVCFSTIVLIFTDIN